MPIRTYIPVFVKDTFRRCPETFGNLLSLMGLGSICGSLAIAGSGSLGDKGRIALIMMAALGGSIVGFAFSHSLSLSLVMVVLTGFSMMAVFGTMNALVQLITTDEMRGRVMSVCHCAFRGGMPIGNLLSGWLVPMFSAPIIVGTNGVLLALIAFYCLLVQRRIAAL